MLDVVSKISITLLAMLVALSCSDRRNSDGIKKEVEIKTFNKPIVTKSGMLCEGIEILRNHKKQHFVSIRPGDSIDKNSYATDIKIHRDLDPVAVYRGQEGLIIQQRLFENEDLQILKDKFHEINKDIVECLGNQWEGTLEDWDGNPKIRIHRYVIKHKHQKSQGQIITILRQHLRSEDYLINFSYK